MSLIIHRAITNTSSIKGTWPRYIILSSNHKEKLIFYVANSMGLYSDHQTTAKIRETKVFFLVHSREYHHNFNLYSKISNKKKIKKKQLAVLKCS